MDQSAATIADAAGAAAVAAGAGAALKLFQLGVGFSMCSMTRAGLFSEAGFT